jgi:hypothetical protein
MPIKIMPLFDITTARAEPLPYSAIIKAMLQLKTVSHGFNCGKKYYKFSNCLNTFVF